MDRSSLSKTRGEGLSPKERNIWVRLEGAPREDDAVRVGAGRTVLYRRLLPCWRWWRTRHRTGRRRRNRAWIEPPCPRHKKGHSHRKGGPVKAMEDVRIGRRCAVADAVPASSAEVCQGAMQSLPGASPGIKRNPGMTLHEFALSAGAQYWHSLKTLAECVRRWENKKSPSSWQMPSMKHCDVPSVGPGDHAVWLTVGSHW